MATLGKVFKIYYAAAELASKTVITQVAILLHALVKRLEIFLITLILRLIVKTLPVTLSSPNLEITTIPGESPPLKVRSCGNVNKLRVNPLING